jgi:hydrophobe/amphiphile efflux-3 (HAE3) family protein
MLDTQSLIVKILDFVRRRSLLVIVATVIITSGFAAALLKIRVDPDLESLLPEDEAISQIMAEQDNASQNYLVVAAEADDPFTLEALAALEAVIGELEELPEILPGITPFNFLTFTKSDGRLNVEPLAPHGAAPRDPEELERFRKNLDQTPLAENLVVSRDRSTLVCLFPAENTDNYTQLMDRIEEILESLDPYYRTYTTGTIPFMKTTESYLSRDLSRLLLLAVAVILVVFFLGFRAKRAVLLPLLTVLMGTVWCFGFMALVGFPVSMISVVIPPLVLALGSSYSIHILNQYFREGNGRGGDKRWIASSIAHVNRTILLAGTTTIFGLLSLLAVSMRQTREFALSTSVGIAACALLSLFFFPALLYRLKAPRAAQSVQVQEGPLTRGVVSIGRAALRGRYPILALLFVLVLLFVLFIHRIEYNTAAMSYFPKNARVVRDMRFFTEKIGGFEQVSLNLSAPQNSSNYFLQPEVLKQIARFEDSLAELPDVSYLSSFVQYLKQLNRIMYGEEGIPDSRAPALLLSRYLRILEAGDQSVLGSVAGPDFSSITITMRIYDSSAGEFIDEVGLRRLLARIDDVQKRELPPEIAVQRWGPILRYLSLSNILQRDAVLSMLIAAAAILCITAMAFRSIPYGLYALVPLATGIMLNVLFMIVAKIPLDMITIMVSSIAIGVGVDDAIHFLIQFRKQMRGQRASGQQDIEKGIEKTLSVTGRPIVLTTLSILAGLLVLSFAAFKPIRYFGVLVAFTLAAACIGTIVVLPAVLSLNPGRGIAGGADL